ncbi:MAG: matrixin family metalloprotease [Marinagarivorans sp.]
MTSISDGRTYYFKADSGYEGEDSFVAIVEADGKKLELHYTLMVVNFSKAYECEKESWEIGLLPSVSGVQTELSANNLINGAYSLFNSFQSLPGTSLGQTTGTGPNAKITLDTDAAGYGWFIDSSPLNSDEFLPTADANIWQAKAGSAAEGKMDLFSVLLHEYGYNLGLEHSAAAMPATLKLGERRLFTPEKLAQLDRLHITFSALVVA